MKIDYDALLPRLQTQRASLADAAYDRFDAVLQLVPADGDGGAKSGAKSGVKTGVVDDAPHAGLFAAVRARRRDEGGDGALTAVLAGGTVVSRLALAADDDVFSRQQKLRAALAPLLAQSSRTLAVDVRAGAVADDAAYTLLVAAARLPATYNKSDKSDLHPPPSLTVAGIADVDAAVSVARANTLARALTQMPPNALTPPVFTTLARSLAKSRGVAVQVMTAAQLKKAGAGAIDAVAQAAATPPSLVRVSYRPSARQRVALVGKGVCYDTGGVNVKPARYMRGMGKDMAGAAVALASVLAAAELRLPVGVDAWLVLAENSIAANAYRPDDVITAANGKRIEIVHSDAEGRMLLADTLTLASRRRPSAIVTYATLTGTMCVALGERMSGFFATDDALRQRALAAAAASGERLCYFPMPDDYKESLKSDVADIKQCAEEGDADHILAALFLREFIDGKPDWLHLDLSAAVCKGGLAAAPGNVTGFGVAWTLALLSQWKQ